MLYSKHGYTHTAMAKLIQMNPHLWGRLLNTDRAHCFNCKKKLPEDGKVWSARISGKDKNYSHKYYCLSCGDVLNL